MWVVKVAPDGLAGRSRCPRALHLSGTGARICMKPGSAAQNHSLLSLALCYADMVSYVLLHGGDTGEKGVDFSVW